MKTIREMYWCVLIAWAMAGLLSAVASGQTTVPAQEPTPAFRDEHHPALVSVQVGDGYSGSGVVVEDTGPAPAPAAAGDYIGHVLTAYHVVSADQRIRVVFRDGTIVSGVVVATTIPDDDVALLRMVVPAAIRPIPIARGVAQRTAAKLHGLKSGVTDAVVLRQNRGQVYLDGLVSPGDSGGAVIVDGELVGVISGGWFWMEPEANGPNAKTPRTWPVRSAGPRPMLRMLDSVRPKPTQPQDQQFQPQKTQTSAHFQDPVPQDPADEPLPGEQILGDGPISNAIAKRLDVLNERFDRQDAAVAGVLDRFRQQETALAGLIDRWEKCRAEDRQTLVDAVRELRTAIQNIRPGGDNAVELRGIRDRIEAAANTIQEFQADGGFRGVAESVLSTRSAVMESTGRVLDGVRGLISLVWALIYLAVVSAALGFVLLLIVGFLIVRRKVAEVIG
jgi:hypothetical protein